MNSDPFKREREIREGKLDNEMPGFEELTGWLHRVPMTWLPALLASCVHQCVLQGVFQEGRLVEVVKGAEERAKDPTSILRKESPAGKQTAGTKIDALERENRRLTFCRAICECTPEPDNHTYDRTTGEMFASLWKKDRDNLLSIIRDALSKSGCDGDLCLYEWHERARQAINDAEQSQ